MFAARTAFVNPTAITAITVDFLVVAGGGAGGSASGGGGGAGGTVYTTGSTLTAGANYNAFAGAGGTF